MITLWHCRDARSFRPLWALEELGLPYELKLLPFPPRFHARDYLDENPLGTIPLLVDGETRMTESSAMIEYLSMRHGNGALSVRPDEAGYGAYLNGLLYGEATLTFPQTLVLRYTRLEPEDRRNPQVAGDYARWFLARLRGLDARLETAPFVAGERFTGADISVAYALLLAETLDLSEQFSPAVTAYWARMRDRPAFARAKAAQAGTDRDVKA
ncbi:MULTISPECIES: glutathione S-transferase family protein [Caulobacter]|jgi:glutathione S-transferase|uniref:Glutathione S-transferase n=1 Tax=Caulobacter vibrioides OR37 TaxID=1292034 RepID=R0EHT0_CAUVI|nr:MULTISPECIES: glutathione S-transferase family protein [Caulobacter]ENZ80752.1 glutathione S-transferase [Caulobacter vibrioides OR37]MBQ1562223.1 glutathione S-transferase family protein [Caulobacter sp.]